MSITKMTSKLQATFSIAGLISVYQPVREQTLYQQLKPIISSSSLKEILQQLTQDQTIILESGHYRITRRGQKRILQAKVHPMRDIRRMLYLTERSAKGRCPQ